MAQKKAENPGIPKLELAKMLNISIPTLSKKLGEFGIQTVTDPVDNRIKRVSSKDLAKVVAALRKEPSAFEAYLK